MQRNGIENPARVRPSEAPPGTRTVRLRPGGRRLPWVALAVALPVCLVIGMAAVRPDRTAVEVQPAPVLSVSLIRPRVSMLPLRIPAMGNVTAWQEASVGAESDGLRLAEVRVEVGERVRRGQVLARFDPRVVEAEWAEAKAAIVLAEAQASEADANARRAKELDGSGALSAQQIDRYLAEARAARARLEAASAAERRARLRVAHARVLAPSDGVITSRTATVGAVLPAGEELFRLIKDGRLEWRAAVSVEDLDRLSPGQAVRIALPGSTEAQGRLRMVSPVIDTTTHSGLVYVDLPDREGIRAGAFAKGYIDVGQSPAMTLPQGAVLVRDGFHYVMRAGPGARVTASKVTVGRRSGGRVEITGGLAASQQVIASGLAFLSEGDVVRVVDPPSRGAP